MKHLFLPILFVLAVLFSCRETETDETVNKNTPASYDLYVAGNDESSNACYWKNMVKTVLTAGSGCTAKKVTVDNNNVYVEGYKQDLTKYYYWKNNVKYDIEQQLNLQSTDNFKLSDIEFKNGDVHIVGSIKNLLPTSNNDTYQLCYWKNSSKTVLNSRSIAEHNSFESDLEIINNDIYIKVARNYNAGNYDEGYYKNGVYYFLSNTKNYFKFLHDNSGVYLIAKNRQNNNLEQYNLTTNTYTPFPSNINSNTFRTAEWDNNNKYYIQQQDYYKNTVQYNLYPIGSDFRFLDDFKVLDDKIYKILHKDHLGVDYKVYVNDVEVQTTANTSNNMNARLRSLTIIPN
nr:hypothetical protein [uncultured Chryseobacterium sp.]